MKKRNAAVILCLGLLLLSPWSHAGENADAGSYLKKNVVERKLSNGITLVMLDRGFAPTLALEISFRVGSADESYNTAGAAHLLEHMLFKGTETLGTTDWARERILLNQIEALGETLDRLRLENPANTRIPELEKEFALKQREAAQYVVNAPYDRIYTANGGVGFNASTSKDMTGYHIELPSNKLDLWARIESGRLQAPVFREYYLERQNVLQERRMRYDSGGDGMLMEQLMAIAFIAHPYRHPIVGWESNIPFLSLDEVRRFYRRHYIPSRMTITIIGKQDVNETARVVERYFGGLTARPEPEEIIVREPAQMGERRFVVHDESSPVVMIGWHKPAYPDRDDYVCDVLAEILAGGRTSRLYRSLVLEKRIAASVDAWNGFPGARYPNLLVVSVEPREGHSGEEVERAVYAEIESLRNSVGDEDIRKVVVSMESDLTFDLETNKGIAHLLSYYGTVLRDWRYAADYVGVLRTVTPADIRTVIGKYLTADNRTVGTLLDTRTAARRAQ